jgi:hypothetical protein
MVLGTGIVARRNSLWFVYILFASTSVSSELTIAIVSTDQADLQPNKVKIVSPVIAVMLCSMRTVRTLVFLLTVSMFCMTRSAAKLLELISTFGN